ncbi:MAG: CvpA family protein [Planctomycetales bacterium]|nr:CvpA family protein [Planctomycetales bacterium]
MIVVLVAATAWGVYKGLAWQIASIASIVFSYLVAFQFRGPLAAQIKADPPWNVFLAMLLLYLGVSLVVWIGFRMVKETIDRVKLHEFDRHVGGVFGLAKGVVLCILITMFGVGLLGESEKQQIIHSNSGYYIAVLLDKSHGLLPAEMNDHLHPLLHTLDQSLPEGYEGYHEHEVAPAPLWQNPAPATGDPYRLGQQPPYAPETANYPPYPPPYPDVQRR